MLAKNMERQPINSLTETEVCQWVSDGVSFFIGFTGTGTYSAEFRLYIKNTDDGTEDCWYVYQTSPGNRTAYLADRATRIPEGHVVSLRIHHDSSQQERFVGTILGGEY